MDFNEVSKRPCWVHRTITCKDSELLSFVGLENGLQKGLKKNSEAIKTHLE